MLYLAFVIGGWEYKVTPIAEVADIFSFVPVLIVEVASLQKQNTGVWTIDTLSKNKQLFTDAEKETLASVISGYFETPGTIQPIKSYPELIEPSKRAWCELVRGEQAHFVKIPALPEFD